VIFIVEVCRPRQKARFDCIILTNKHQNGVLIVPKADIRLGWVWKSDINQGWQSSAKQTREKTGLMQTQQSQELPTARRSSYGFIGESKWRICCGND